MRDDLVDADIWLLGPVGVGTAADMTPVPVGGAKLEVLLAMLAQSPGEVVPSSRLADALWGDRPPQRAETGLRVHMKRLRDALYSLPAPTPRLVHRSDGYVLLVEASRVDAVCFASLLAEAAHATPTHALELLESALKLWRGEPFGGHTDHDVLRLEAERLRELYETALEERAGTLLTLGENETAISQLEGLVRRQPLRERRTLLLMRALYRAGRQADALRAYRNLRRVLSRELGLTPTPELRAAEVAVLQQDPSMEPWRDRTPDSPDQPDSTRLPWWLTTALDSRMLGRDREVDELLALLDRMTGDPGEPSGARAVVLAGEPGVGKTRLLAECVKRAADRGTRVLAGWCDPGGVVPFRPLLEAFRTVVADSGSGGATVSATASLLAAHLTEGADGRPRTDPETDRLRFFEALARLLHEVADSGPVLLAIDDIHWLDPSSSALLSHLLRRPARHPVVLTACQRRDPAEHTQAWRQTLEELQRRGACRIVEVPELGKEATTRLINELAAEVGVADANALAARIWPVTSGNPLFVREVVTQLAAQGDVAGVGRWVPVPATLLEAVADRVHQLRPATRAVLNAAAVLGRHFSLEDVAVVSAYKAEAVLEALDEAREARLVDEVPVLLDEFAFRHALLREAVHDLMSRSRRLRLHAAAAAAYEGRSDVPSVLARASHLLDAVPLCPAEVAGRAAVDAADAAMVRLAFEEAARVADRALDMFTSGESTNEPLRWELFIRLGRARAYRGEDTASDEAFAAAADVARRLGDPTRLAIAAMGDDLDTRALTPSPARLGIIEEALRDLGDTRTPLRAALASTYVVLGSRTLGARQVRPVADDTVALARGLGDPLALSKALLAWATCAGSAVPATDRLDAATEALSLAESASHPTRAARALLTRVACLMRLGHADEAIAEHARFQALAERSAVPRHVWHADVAGAAIARMTGDFPSAEARARRAYASGERSGIAEATMALGVHTFVMSWHRGSLAGLRGMLDDFAASRPDLVLWRLAAGLAAVANGDKRAGRHVLDALLATVPTLDPADEFWSNELMLAGQLACDLGVGGPEADLLWPLLLTCRGQFDVFGAMSGTLGPVDRVLGLLAACRGDHETATSLMSGALEMCRAMHADTWVVWAGDSLAAELWAVGRAADARRVVTNVAPIAQRLDMLSRRPSLQPPSAGDSDGPTPARFRTG
jgi:DNA-binding SARP family transcriptional activator